MCLKPSHLFDSSHYKMPFFQWRRCIKMAATVYRCLSIAQLAVLFIALRDSFFCVIDKASRWLPFWEKKITIVDCDDLLSHWTMDSAKTMMPCMNSSVFMPLHNLSFHHLLCVNIVVEHSTKLTSFWRFKFFSKAGQTKALLNRPYGLYNRIPFENMLSHTPLFCTCGYLSSLTKWFLNLNLK